ncbi:hypothetical protein ACIO7M_12535 [Streptomyces toxytricini]|uniref:Uncharacterized protein n=1 Tax=Streptomyces toxytricini TaxID=67369 RepID=A0ABW8EFC3_STRT5
MEITHETSVHEQEFEGLLAEIDATEDTQAVSAVVVPDIQAQAQYPRMI